MNTGICYRPKTIKWSYMIRTKMCIYTCIWCSLHLFPYMYIFMGKNIPVDVAYLLFKISNQMSFNKYIINFPICIGSLTSTATKYQSP